MWAIDLQNCNTNNLLSKMNLWTLPIIIIWFIWAKFYMYPEEISTLVSWIWAIGAVFIAYYFFLLPTSSGERQLVGKKGEEMWIQLFSNNRIGLILPSNDSRDLMFVS